MQWTILGTGSSLHSAVRNLPHWSHVGCHRKLPRDWPPNPPQMMDPESLTFQCTMDSDIRRVASLKKDVLFLQKQHRETLRKLHEEIEELKRENKELHYQSIMDPQQSEVSPRCRSQTQQPSYTEQTSHPLHGLPSPSANLRVDTASTSHLLRSDLNAKSKRGLITSLLPLRIDGGPFHSPYAPTLQECEVIIRQLCKNNNLQSQELLRVKAILKDLIVNNKKMSQEAYTLTKAYPSDADRDKDIGMFPKLPLKSLPKKLPPAPIGMRERVILPAIKQSLNSRIEERQKKARAVLRSRLRRVVQ